MSQAFPTMERGGGGLDLADPGMTLRDYFAAHAPQPERGMPLAEHCAFRYRYADEMIRARKAGASDKGESNE